MNIEIFRFGPALSPFRLAALLPRIRPQWPALSHVRSDYVHFVESEQPLGAGRRRLLERLLRCSGLQPAQGGDGAQVIVVPRPGTISPWSSKATDILHQCGLTEVRRIERGRIYTLEGVDSLSPADDLSAFFDRMTETVLTDPGQAGGLFQHPEPRPVQRIDLGGNGREALQAANERWGLALSDGELDYLLDFYRDIGRDPTDVELMMFAQANSEHCRHKIFNARWVIDGQEQAHSLFEMIRNTFRRHPGDILSAYRDNAAVVAGPEADWFFPQDGFQYRTCRGRVNLVMKVETHNHPTAIAPFPGAATGSGGEIRDEGATGRGARPKAGLTGFAVSNLRLPGALRPWERDYGKPGRIASALEIMLDGPIGAASFNNEFGRPALCGYFRTFEQETCSPGGRQVFGYHKPIMLAGGVGNIRDEQVSKRVFPPGTRLIVIGGPALLIGLGGGAASSMNAGASDEELDFASVQRGNPEMQRRCQEVINQCWQLAEDNPILSIHDVGAGGLSNALPELVEACDRGADFFLREIPSHDSGMSPMELWCNEAQERYVLAVSPADLPRFEEICQRERCPFAVVGQTRSDRRLRLIDRHFDTTPIDMPLEVLLGRPPRMSRHVHRVAPPQGEIDTTGIDLAEAVERVLKLPTVADKTFLITIGDRSVTGHVARDQMVGPWQVPVADVAVTTSDYTGCHGEALAMGERPPVALLDAAASARLAVGEALTNMAAADVDALEAVVLSANWMAAAGHPGEDARLYEAVRAVGMELCPALGLAIPVGKDSMSMKTTWREGGEEKSVVAPVSLVVSAFAPVRDVRRTLTPLLERGPDATELWLIDLGCGQQRLGGSCLTQVFNQVGGMPPDLDDPLLFKRFFSAIGKLRRAGLLCAYHDRSDGGMLVTLAEMAFASHCGLDVALERGSDPLAALFSEELGAVIQTRRQDHAAVEAVLAGAGLLECSRIVARPNDDDRFRIRQGGKMLLDLPRVQLQQWWSETSLRMQSLRDDPQCAREQFDALADAADPGLHARLSFDPHDNPAAAVVHAGRQPKVAIVREQGVNGHVEMAAAFDRAGFAAVDVHMSDLLSGRQTLDAFHGLVACGGFSYGDVLGAGAGWAQTILCNPVLREQFAAFFHRPDTFALGVCNGCQMMSQLRELIPGTEDWPVFRRNRSEQFEARLSLVQIDDSPSVLFAGMAGSRLPIVVAHGEGRAVFAPGDLERVKDAGQVVLHYVDHYGRPAESYPANPNGSPGGITGLCSRDGRVTIMMPHPERVFRTVQFSWAPPEWGEESPWLRLFRNARRFVG